jgi:hypothetical protein
VIIVIGVLFFFMVFKSGMVVGLVVVVGLAVA